MAVEKNKGPIFTVYVRRVAILSTEITGVKTLQEAVDKAKEVDLDDFTEEDSSFLVTGVNTEKHYETD